MDRSVFLVRYEASSAKNEGEEGWRVRGGRAWSVRKRRRELGQGVEAVTIASLQVGTQYAFYMRPALGGAGIYSHGPEKRAT